MWAHRMLDNKQTPTFAHPVHTPSKKRRAIWFILGALLLFSVVLGAAFAVRTSQEPPRTFSNLPVTTVTLPIEGMTCASCVARVKKTLKSIDGVTEVEVSLEHRNARVSYLDAHVSPERLAAAINNLGYRVGTPEPQRTR